MLQTDLIHTVTKCVLIQPNAENPSGRKEKKNLLWKGENLPLKAMMNTGYEVRLDS